MHGLFSDGFPAFVTADQEVKKYIDHAGTYSRVLNCSGLCPDTFVIMAAHVHPGRRGQGIATAALSALRDLAGGRGWAPGDRAGAADPEVEVPAHLHRQVRCLDA